MADFGSGGNGPFRALLSRSLGIEVVSVSRCGNTYSDRGESGWSGRRFGLLVPVRTDVLLAVYLRRISSICAYTSEGEVIGFPPRCGVYFKDPAW